MAQAGFGPPSLPVGTEVSAKYRGAFCEAKVKTVVRIVKCKVLVKDGQSSMFVNDDEVRGPVKLGAVVEVKHPDTGQPVEATVNKLIDHSTYTVVFDDGDERTLRRTQLCLKGDKHFIESETLDNLPLSHPEHFGTPVLQNKKAKRKTDGESDENESSEEESPRRAMYRGRHQELVGKLMLVDLPHRKGSVIPALVVLPDANCLSDVKNRDQILVRSFKDSKFMTVTRKDLKEFSRVVAIKNDDKTMRTAFEKALLYHDTKELPVGWDREEMLGSDIDEEDDGDDEDEYASEDEPFEEKDRFVAQLYKFMDDRGTPINKGPCIGNKDLNLYKLFKIVQNLGGYNKVTKEMKWSVVYSKMGLPSLHLNPAHQIKTAYKKYLDAYETFYRKLGSTMGTLSRPGRARQNSGRSILNFRAREKSPRSPKPPEKNKDAESENVKAKPDITSEKSEDSQDAVSVASTDDGDIVTRRTPRRESRTQAVREDTKEKKEDTGKGKKDEKREEILKTKKDDNAAPKSKKDETPAVKTKKEEAPTARLKKDEVVIPKSKKDVAGPPKGKKEDITPAAPRAKKDESIKGKKEEESEKKEEKKSTRKMKAEEEKEVEKEEKKPVRGAKKEKEEKEEEKKEETKPEVVAVVNKDSPKKRITRRKLMPGEVKKEPEPKEEVEDKKEPPKKTPAKEVKAAEKKEKEIPRTLERRDSRAAEKKEALAKMAEKKEVKPVEKKAKSSEEKKPKKDKKTKEEGTDEGSDNDEEESTEQEKPDISGGKYDYSLGSKLRVKYGRGKNQKIYIAKVVDFGKDGVHKTYLVHYAGWNTRYDEWIRSDRVVSVLDKPDSEKVKTAPIKPAPALPSGLKKMGPATSAATTTKAATTVKKPGQIFRTPKMIGAKTRATRSSSSETSVTPKKADKRMTRRRSFLTDSTGSKSPESHISSDADDNTGSERADDDDNTKEYKDEEDDILDVEEDEAGAVEESGKDKSAELDTSLEEDMNVKEDSASEIESEKMTAEEDNKEPELELRKKEVKESNDNESLRGRATGGEIVKPEGDVKKESKEITKADIPKEAVSKPPVEAAKSLGVSEAKAERATVVVTEVKNPVDEIRSAVYEDVDNVVDHKEEVNIDEKLSMPSTSDTYADNEYSESPKLEIVDEKEPEQKESSTEKPDLQSSPHEKLPEDSNAPVLVSDQGIPQLRKMDIEPEKKEKEPQEKGKVGRGRKKEQTKDSKKSVKASDAVSTNITPEIPTLEPMTRDLIPANNKTDPSPYDFDAEVEPPWQPEITKKWEPTQKAPAAAKESKESLVAAEEGDEKEKKKVKKKAKKKPISPEFVGEEGSLSVDETVAAAVSSDTLTSPSSGDVSTEKQSIKKKGRKKKEVSPETTKEVIEQYEITVNSVVEAVKHSLQESESDHEQRPAVKRRRVKRMSESDKKDVAVRMGKMGRKTTSRESLDILDNGKPDEKQKRVSASQSPLPNEPSSSKTPKSSELSSATSSVPEAGECSSIRESKREPSFCESQGFEPQLDQHDPSAPFDNTPPTTPEHEEEGSANAAMQHQQNLYHSDDLSSKSDIQKDSAKVICSSSSTASSISLHASSSNLAPSKSASESPSDNDVTSTASTDNLDSAHTAQQSESSGTDQDVPSHKKRKAADEALNGVSVPKKKKRVHGTRSRTARKSPKYTGNSDSQGSACNTPNHCPESPPTKFADLSKSPRPAKFNFNADLGEYLEGEARCNFLITKMREIKAIYMNLKSEVASIDRRRKRARRKERESSQISTNDKDVATT